MAQWLNHPNSSISTCSNSENTNSGKLYPAARLTGSARAAALQAPEKREQLLDFLGAQCCIELMAEFTHDGI